MALNFCLPMARPRPSVVDSAVSFTVIHFAGQVTYDTTSFMDKNRDELPEACVPDVLRARVALPLGRAC